MKRRALYYGFRLIMVFVAACAVLLVMTGSFWNDAQRSDPKGVNEALDPQILEHESSLTELLSSGYSPYMPDPAPFTLVQPDGSEFDAVNVGEKIGGHVETLDGYTMMRDETGWWTYAQKDFKGALMPSEYIVGRADPKSALGFQKHLKNDLPDVRSRFDDMSRATRAPPTNTTWKAIAIMLEFTDESFDAGNNRSHFEQLLNGTTGNTMRTYYREVSYNKFDIEVDVVGPFSSKYNMTYYGADVGPKDSNPNTRDDGYGPVSNMTEEALWLADPTVDFTKYDLDSDGAIDALFIIHAGGGQESDTTNKSKIWSHMSFVGYMTNDSVFASRYSTEPEDGRVGVFAHEFGHVLGLPDLYDTDYSSSGIGNWGIMAGGSWNGGGNTPAHFCAWSKIELGWLEPTIVTSDVSLFQIELPPVEYNQVVYKIWAHDPSKNTKEYFLVENRQQIGYDAALPGEGIMVWHIDESQSDNDNESHYLVDLEEADGAQELETPNGPSQATDPFVNNVTGFRNTTAPNSASYNGSETGVWVWNISAIDTDGNMSLGFMEIYSGPDDIFLHDPQTNGSILPVYDFTINDTGFPDEDVGIDNDGNNGSYVLEWRKNGTTNPWDIVPAQTMISWVGGGQGIINSTMLTEGFWDFRVNITDEEGHQLYTPEVYNVAVPTKIPPVADAGLDNITDVLAPTVLDGSNSTDNSGFIAWFNWSFGDGLYLNSSSSIVVHNWSAPGIYTVILNVSDSFGNWDIDTVNITVMDMGAPVTTMFIGNPKYRADQNQSWNVTGYTQFILDSIDNYVGVNFTWYTIDGEYFNYNITGPFTLSGYPEGPHNLTWGAEDVVGNNETGNTGFFIVDNSPPITSLNIGTPKFRQNPGDLWNVTDFTPFTITYWDEYVGVDTTWYSVSGDFNLGEAFNLSAYDDGLHVIYWSSVDFLGNYEDKNITVALDSTPPSSDIEIGNPRFRVNTQDRWNITVLTELSVANASDGNGCGLNYTWYEIDGVFQLYLGNFTLSPGLHTVSWGGVDFLSLNETQNEIKVFVDDAPPVTSLNLGVPNYGSSPSFIDSTTLLSLTATDGMGSGVASTFYRIDAGSWTLYTGQFNISTLGLHTIKFNSTDNLGFIESTKSYDVYVDNAPPITSLTLGAPNYGSSPLYVDSTTQFTLSSSDGTGSGVKSIWYRLDSGAWTKYTSFFTIPSAGSHTLQYNATDNLGHAEATLSLNIYVDNNAPSVSLNVGEPKFGSGPTKVGIGTPFNLTANDGPGSGVASIWYNIDGTGWVLYTGNFSVGISGNHNLFYYAKDNLGHDSLTNQFDIFVDTTPPTTTLTIGTPKYGSPTIFVNATTGFNLTASDGPGCGVASTWYRIDSGSWSLYTGNFTLSSEGSHTIYYNSTDVLDQMETTHSLDVIVDMTSPQTAMTVGDPKYGASPTYVTTGTVFTLSASDSGGSGIKETWYRFGSTIWVQYAGGFTIPTGGSYTVEYYSKDNLDHTELIKSLGVYVDIQKPVTSIGIGNPQYGFMPTFVNSSTMFNLSASDGTGCGVQSTWYSIDSGSWVKYTGSFVVASPGAHIVYYNSTDYLGNVESPKGASIFVDLSPPETNITVGEPSYGASPTFVNIATPFSLSAQDEDGVGVASTWYSIDSGNWNSYSSEFIVSSPGPHTIYYNSTDYLGQREPARSLDIFCDNMAPVTNITVGEPAFRQDESHNWNVSLSTQFILGSLDTDVDVVWFTINGKYIKGSVFDLGSFSLAEGLHTITWGSLDLLGNNETGNTMTVFLDTSAPSTSLTPGNPKFRKSQPDSWTITPQTDFYLQSGYQKSGLEAIWYTINGEYNEGAQFDLLGKADGTYTITWGARDNLGHNETGNSITVILTQSLALTDLIVGEPRYRGNAGDLWNVTVSTPFALTAFSDYSDVDYTWYTIDGNSYQGSLFTLEGNDEGLRTITFGTMDIFGTSESWGQILVLLDDSPPESGITPGEPKYRESAAFPWKVTRNTNFEVSSSDEYSGVAFTWYTIDGRFYRGNEFLLTGLSDGMHAIAWGAMDNLDFNETGNQIEVVLENSAPEISLEVGIPNGTVNDVLYVTSKTKFTLKFQDTEPAMIYYRFEGESTYRVYTAPFSPSKHDTRIIYWGEDVLGNKASESFISFVVSDKDTDDDGKMDIEDQDDDNDGLLDIEEDPNQNGILDEGESDPLNADTDSDGHMDSKDKYPQDPSRFRDPTDWERVPVFGQFEQGLCITLIIIGIILLVVMLYIFRRYRMFRARSSWKKEEESPKTPNNR